MRPGPRVFATAASMASRSHLRVGFGVDLSGQNGGVPEDDLHIDHIDRSPGAWLWSGAAREVSLLGTDFGVLGGACHGRTCSIFKAPKADRKSYEHVGPAVCPTQHKGQFDSRVWVSWRLRAETIRSKVRALQGVSLSVIDQGISSLGNALVILAAARAGSVTSFAAISLILSIGLGGVSVTRAISIPLLGLYARASSPSRDIPGSLLSTGFLIGCVAAIVALGSLAVTSLSGAVPPAAVALLILGVSLASAQDVLRVSAITSGRPGDAIFMDGIWLLFSGIGMLALNQTLIPMEVFVAGAWSLGAGVSASLGIFLLRVRPAPKQVVRLWRGNRDILLPTVASSATIQMLSSLLAILVVQLFAAADLAAWRGAGTVLSPVTLLIAVLPVFVIKWTNVSSSGSNDRDHRALSVLAICILIFALSISLGAALSKLPPNLGAVLLGETWSVASSLLMPVAITVGASAFVVSANAVHNSREQHATAASNALLNAAVIVSVIGIAGVLGVSISGALYVSATITLALSGAMWVRVLVSGWSTRS